MLHNKYFFVTVGPAQMIKYEKNNFFLSIHRYIPVFGFLSHAFDVTTSRLVHEYNM